MYKHKGIILMDALFGLWILCIMCALLTLSIQMIQKTYTFHMEHLNEDFIEIYEK